MINTFKWKKNKLLGVKKFLVLAIDEKGILATDMYHDGEGLHVKNSAYMDFPEGVSLDNPGKLGNLLGQFIKDKKFSARKAIIGLPAKWLMIRGKDMPPSSGISVAGILKIHAEHEFSINPDDLAIDYTGNISSDNPSRLFLGAVLKKNYGNVLEAVRSAGLKVLSVTVSSMTLRSVLCRHMAQPFPDYFIFLRPGYAEILVGDREQIIDVKQIQMGKTGGPDSLLSELKRIISFSRNTEKSGEKESLMILDLSDSDGNEARVIQDSLSSQVDITACEAKTLMRKMELASSLGSKESLVSAAIIQNFLLRDAFFLDFYNSRMNEKVVWIKKNQVMWASAIVLCFIIIVFNTIYTWKSDKKDVAELKQRLSEMSEDVKSAQDIVQKMDYARKWYSDRPEVLRCLYELTMIFPIEGSIWATNLALNEEMKGIVSGRATDEKSVIEVLDGLKNSNLFNNVQMIYLRENGQSSQEVSFSMSFSFKNKGL